MAERTIKHGLFTWWEGDPPVEKMAFQGATVDLPDDAIERGEELGAFWTEGEIQKNKGATTDVVVDDESTGDDGSGGDDETITEIDPETDDAGKIAAFITQESLNAQETLELAEDDEGNAVPALAEKVHAAELLAHAPDGRVTVTKALEAAINRG